MVTQAAFPHASALASAGLEIEADPEAESGSAWLVRGNTFHHKDLLKAHGGRWSRSRGAWAFDDPSALDLLGAALAGDGVPASAPGFAEAPMRFVGRQRAGTSEKPHYHGHRQRLRERFRESDGEGMPDYELLELLLFFSVRYIDVKPLAKRLLAEFGSLGGVLAAEPARLERVMGTGDPAHQERLSADGAFTVTHLKAIHRLLQRVLAEDVRERPVITSWQALLDYLKIALGHEPIEQFRVLFLDKKNILIRDEVQQKGTVDHTPLYPREIAKRALELGASAAIMVHNHPSGDPTPSRADIEMTKQVEAALSPIRVALHDHLIIGQTRHLSFRSEGLL
jgi:DNA repair protein RadC